MQPMALQRLIIGRPCIARARTVIGRASLWSRVEHSWSYWSKLLEAAPQDDWIQMPLSAKIGVVSCSAKGLAPGRHIVGELFGAKCAQARIQHGAAGNTDSGRP